MVLEFRWEVRHELRGYNSFHAGSHDENKTTPIILIWFLLFICPRGFSLSKTGVTSFYVRSPSKKKLFSSISSMQNAIRYDGMTWPAEAGRMEHLHWQQPHHDGAAVFFGRWICGDGHGHLLGTMRWLGFTTRIQRGYEQAAKLNNR